MIAELAQADRQVALHLADCCFTCGRQGHKAGAKVCPGPRADGADRASLERAAAQERGRWCELLAAMREAAEEKASRAKRSARRQERKTSARETRRKDSEARFLSWKAKEKAKPKLAKLPIGKSRKATTKAKAKPAKLLTGK